jgi:hypothetical protein
LDGGAEQGSQWLDRLYASDGLGREHLVWGKASQVARQVQRLPDAGLVQRSEPVLTHPVASLAGSGVSHEHKHRVGRGQGPKVVHDTAVHVIGQLLAGLARGKPDDVVGFRVRGECAPDVPHRPVGNRLRIAADDVSRPTDASGHRDPGPELLAYLADSGVQLTLVRDELALG